MKEFDFVIDCHVPTPMAGFDYQGFWQAFTFAELQCFKTDSNKPIVDLFKKSMVDYVDDADKFARLSTTLNHKCWYWNDNADFEKSSLYACLWEKVHSFALDNYKDEMLDTYLEITD